MLALDGVGVGVRYRDLFLLFGHRRLWPFLGAHGRAPSPRQRRTRENARVAGGRGNKRTRGVSFSEHSTHSILGEASHCLPIDRTPSRQKEGKKSRPHGLSARSSLAAEWCRQKMSLSRGSLVWVASLLLSSHPKRYFVGSRAIGSKTGQCGTFCGGLSSEQMRVPFFRVSVGDRSFHARPGD